MRIKMKILLKIHHHRHNILRKTPTLCTVSPINTKLLDYNIY